MIQNTGTSPSLGTPIRTLISLHLSRMVFCDGVAVAAANDTDKIWNEQFFRFPESEAHRPTVQISVLFRFEI